MKDGTGDVSAKAATLRSASSEASFCSVSKSAWSEDVYLCTCRTVRSAFTAVVFGQQVVVLDRKHSAPQNLKTCLA